MGTESTVVLRAILRDELTAALKSIQNDLVDTGKKGSEAGDSITSSWTNMASGFYMAQTAISKAYTGIKAITEAAAEYDSIRMRLRAVEGSSIISEKDFKMIQETAKMPGLGFGEAANAFSGLRSLRVAGSEAANIIKGIAEANAAMGGGAEAFGRVMYQVQQSVGVGKLMGEDLRAIKEAIPNIGALMQDAYGTADAEAINKRLQESGKSVKDFWAEMANMAHGLPPAGETITNNLDNIGDAWKRVKANFGDTIPIKQATSALGSLLEKVAEYQEGVKDANKVRDLAASKLGLSRAPTQIWTMTHQKEWSSALAQARAQLLVEEYNAEQADKTKQAGEAKKAEDLRQRQLADAKIDAARKEAKRVAEEIHKAEVDADKYVTRTGANEVTLREGVGFGEEESRRASQRDREAAERADKKAMEERARERERIKKEIQRVDLEIAREEENLEKTQTKIVKAELHQRLEEQREYYRNWRELATTSIDSVAQTLIFGEGSLTKKMEAIMQRAESSLLSSGIAMLVNSGMAYMTGGASLAAGPVGFNILSGLAEMFGGRAGGGDAIGPRLVGEKRAEVFTPLVPGTIHNTTHNYGGITVVLPNVRNAQDLARDLPRATRSAASNRRQTSV